MRTFKLLFFVFLASFGLNAQDLTDMPLDQLKTMKGEKEASIGAIQAELDAINGAIDKYPGWKTKMIGTLGGNLNGFSNWFAAPDQNSTSNSFVFDLFASARYDGEKSFLYNDLILSLGRLTTNTGVDQAPDVTTTVPNKLNLSSLYGYKLMPKLALSAGLQYNTGILGSNANGSSLFNNPGDLDIGAGVTWTPFDDFYLMVHPLNYHFKFGDNPNFASAAGAKIKAGYARELIKGVSWISGLEGFFAYSTPTNDAGVELPSASWYEWTNTFAFSVWKGIGVGITYGLRRADSEILETQTRYSIGLSYTL